MGLKKALLRLLRRKSRAEEAIQSPIQSIESRFKSDQSLIQSRLNQQITEPEKKPTFLPFPKPLKPSPPVELQKDSLQLGIAAGYTGRALKEIESSLTRIESHMVTRDWFASQFEDRTPELIEILKKHDENAQKRFESIESLLKSLQRTAEKAPEPIRAELFEQIKAVESKLPLTPKMQQLLAAVKESGELSYRDLSLKLRITENALRGLLSNTIRRTDKIQRFKRDGKGWVKHSGSISTDSTNIDSITDSISNQSDKSFNQSAESL